jgi:RNA polymerase sigma-70 factor (ECF subfamily)
VSKRNTYSDTFTGAADKGIRRILGCSDEDESARKLRRVMLKVINNELTPRQKEIIMLYYFRDEDMVAIGETLGITPQAVSQLMLRARIKMFRILQYYI